MKTLRLALAVSCLALLPAASFAAQANKPLTGDMLGGGTAGHSVARTYPLDSGRGQPTPYGEDTVTGQTLPAPSPVAEPFAVAQANPIPTPIAAEEPAAAPTKRAFGQTTRDLLQLQASGTAAGKKLPILGDQASASYKRYLDSFDHPLPEFFEATVKQEGSGN